jgi:hypothetical protein
VFQRDASGEQEQYGKDLDEPRHIRPTTQQPGPWDAWIATRARWPG